MTLGFNFSKEEWNMRNRGIAIDFIVYNVTAIVYYMYDYIADNREFRIYDFLDKNKTALIYFNRLASMLGSYDNVVVLLTTMLYKGRFMVLCYEVEVIYRKFKIGNYIKKNIVIKYDNFTINLFKDDSEDNRYYFMDLLVDNMWYIISCNSRDEVLRLMDDEDLYERLEKGEK